MGRGGGSHGGGGFRGYRSHRRRSYRSHRGDGSSGFASTLVLTIFMGIFVVGIFAGLILTIVFGSWVDDVCDGIDNINVGEQRTCKPLKTENVKISESWEGITAYRYDNNNTPPTQMHTTNISYMERVRSYGWEYYDFALSANGSVSFTYTVANSSKTMDVHLMTLKQYEHFKDKESVGETLWSMRETMVARHNFTATVGGVYFIVINNLKYSGFYVQEDLNITTEVYLVDPTTAKEYCPDGEKYTFQNVEPTETIIVNYSGNNSYVNVVVHRGKGSFNKNIIVFIVFIIIVILIVGGLFAFLVWSISDECEKCLWRMSMKTSKKSSKKTSESDIKISQPDTTPGTVPMTPVGPTPGATPYDPTTSGAATAPNPYPDGVPPDAPSAPPPGYVVDSCSAPNQGHVDYYGAPSTMV